MPLKPCFIRMIEKWTLGVGLCVAVHIDTRVAFACGGPETTRILGFDMTENVAIVGHWNWDSKRQGPLPKSVGEYRSIQIVTSQPVPEYVCAPGQVDEHCGSTKTPTKPRDPKSYRLPDKKVPRTEYLLRPAKTRGSVLEHKNSILWLFDTDPGEIRDAYFADDYIVFILRAVDDDPDCGSDFESIIAIPKEDWDNPLNKSRQLRLLREKNYRMAASLGPIPPQYLPEALEYARGVNDLRWRWYAAGVRGLSASEIRGVRQAISMRFELAPFALELLKADKMDIAHLPKMQCLKDNAKSETWEEVTNAEAKYYYLNEQYGFRWQTRSPPTIETIVTMKKYCTVPMHSKQVSYHEHIAPAWVTWKTADEKIYSAIIEGMSHCGVSTLYPPFNVLPVDRDDEIDFVELPDGRSGLRIKKSKVVQKKSQSPWQLFLVAPAINSRSSENTGCKYIPISSRGTRS